MELVLYSEGRTRIEVCNNRVLRRIFSFQPLKTKIILEHLKIQSYRKENRASS